MRQMPWRFSTLNCKIMLYYCAAFRHFCLFFKLPSAQTYIFLIVQCNTLIKDFSVCFVSNVCLKCVNHFITEAFDHSKISPSAVW